MQLRGCKQIRQQSKPRRKALSMVKMNIYDGDNHVIESVDNSDQPPLNDPACTHPTVVVVEDNSGIDGVTAHQCQICSVGWLIKDKINVEE